MLSNIPIPTLKDLPSPPLGKMGWPWTEATNLPLVNSIDTAKLPRISIVTPSYNWGKYIEETIRSVLLQGYPNLEYIIIDGGSSDSSVEIIKRYEPWLAYWVSERDRGQAHAINKGMERATGEIIAYLNSDDYYLPGALLSIGKYFREFPQTDLCHGRCRYVDSEGNKIGEQFASISHLSEIIDLWGVWWQRRQFVQPEVFWSKRIADKVGLFKEKLYYVMDYEYWCRILLASGIVGKIDAEIACFRFNSAQKSSQREKVAKELLEVVYPLIWNRQIDLANQQRSQLQGQWVYQSIILSQIERSLTSGEPEWQRWLKLALTAAKYPQVLLVPQFQARAKQWLTKIRYR